jgi:hypothetical protein
MLTTMLPSHAGGDTTGATWPWRDRGRVMLAMALLCHAGGSAVGATWPWRDVNADSSWQHYC